MTAATSRAAITTRDSQVCGQRPTSCGSGISTRPATGSFAIGRMSAKGSAKSSAKCRVRLRLATAAAVACGYRAEQATKLRRRFLGGAQRQHGNAELAGPGEHALQSLLGGFENALPHAVATDFELNLQFAI